MYVEQQRDERDRIQTKIANLNKQRRDYISSQKKEGSNGLEGAMIKALKKQAAAKEYTWQ